MAEENENKSARSIVDNYFAVVDKLNQDHRKIRANAWKDNCEHLNLKDKDGNAIEFPNGMQPTDAAIIYDRACVRLRNKYNRLKKNVKPGLWILINSTLSLEYTVEIPKPIGDGKDEFVVVLAYILNINDGQQDLAFESREMVVDGLLSLPHNKEQL